jgi:hypothetical protein
MEGEDLSVVSSQEEYDVYKSSPPTPLLNHPQQWQSARAQ